MAHAMFDANNSSVSIIREEIEGEAPITGNALILEPNTIDSFGNSIESVARNPISTSRDAKKGTVTSLNSAVELSQDLTVSAFKEMFSSACSANWIGINNLVLAGCMLYDITKENDQWKFKVKKPFFNLPTTASLITSGFRDERKNGVLEIESVDNGIIKIVNAEEHGFTQDDPLDTKGKIVIEWEEIIPTSIMDVNGETMLELPTGIAETLEIGAKVLLEGFVSEDNNGEFTIIDILKDDNSVKLYPALVKETDENIVAGNTIDIYSGDLTGDNAETVDVTISAAGTYKITIDSITSTVTGSQTIQIQVNNTDIVNEQKEFLNANDSFNNLEFTFTKAEGVEQITTITLIGTDLSATGVKIVYQEDDKTETLPNEKKMYVSCETKNWISSPDGLIPYSFITEQGALALFQDYKNEGNNGIKKIVSNNLTDDFIEFSSDTPIIEEKISYSDKAPTIQSIGLTLNKDNLGNIDENGNLILNTELINKLQKLDLFLKGQAIWIGGSAPHTMFEDEYANGLVRIKNIDTENGIIYLDKRILGESKDGIKYVFTPDTEEQLENKDIPIYLGYFLRTYPVGHQNYERISHTIELKTTNDEGESFYEYSVGNLTNTLEIGLPTQEKATLNVAYVSRKALDAIKTQLDWNREQPKYNKVISTPTDVLRCRISLLDESGLATIWTEATININNNVSQEYAIGSLAPIAVSQGNLEITLSGNIFFSNPDVMRAITNNCTLSADTFLTNEDGGIFIDMPSVTLSDGNRDFASNEKIKQSLTATAYLEQEWNYSISSTIFPYLPTEKDDVCR